MKPEDLRLGNYIQDRQYRLCIVKELTEETINAPVIDWPVTGLPHRPIELSEEWLLKFGFEISDDSFSNNLEKHKCNYKEAFLGDNPITKDYMIILKNTVDGWFYRNGYFKIEYVYQLQNLYFALTGEEITIKN